jgi:hypothetical protein
MQGWLGPGKAGLGRGSLRAPYSPLRLPHGDSLRAALWGGFFVIIFIPVMTFRSEMVLLLTYIGSTSINRVP